MSRYFNDGFDAMGGDALEHGFGEQAHKYIDKVKTKTGKWRYIYKKKMAEAIDKRYEKDLPKGYKKTVKGDTVHYEYKDKDGNTVTKVVMGRGLSRTIFENNSKDIEVGPPKKVGPKKAAPKKANVKKKKLTPKTGRKIAEEAMLAGESYRLNAKARKQQAKKKKKK
jgi:hypothetical protein